MVSKPELVHEREFLGALAEPLLPIAPLPSELNGERGRLVGQAGCLRVGLFGRIDMLDAIPKPRVFGDRARAQRPHRLREQSLDQHGFIQPRFEQAVQHREPCSTRPSASRTACLCER